MSGVEVRVDPGLLAWLEAQGMGQLAPGVFGYTVERDGMLLIPFLAANHEGSGDVGRFLDGLPHHRVVGFPNVVSRRLAGMLARRGFVAEVMELDGEPVEVLVRRKGAVG
jgi:hypothetical protein